VTLHPIALPDGDLAYDPSFLGAEEAAALLERLVAELRWEQPRVRLFGREIPSPRLAVWIGDPGARYTYSGLVNEPRPWPAALVPLKGRVEAAAGGPFNAVLANLYRGGADGMGWHADDEPELGPEPVIASVSLGAVRRFVLRHRRRAHPAVSLPLASGSLLVMRGGTQRSWRHALPKTAAPVGARVNLTFRMIGPPG
jgi:alkylated DNA repair dioxygenase AlkB